ncbi:MAG: hypothetical protein H0T79_22110 [Deltaproteobacteria bacterium]|nr:hypothetical protein [Deltaproteobacteria bacterium]
MADRLNELSPGAVNQVSQDAVNAATGDHRTAMALLQAAYAQLASRVAIAEHGPGDRGPIVMGFAQVATDMLGHWAHEFARLDESTDPTHQARIGDVQGEATRFARQLRNRYEAVDETQTPEDEDANLDRDPDAMFG